MRKTIIYAIVAMMMLPVTAAWAVKRQKVEPSYAWTISQPLGLHYPGTIDTLQYNFFRSVIPSLVSNAYATTGNYGSQGQNQIFFDREQPSEFFFEDALSAWLPSVNTQVYYNTRIPMTLMTYTFGGNRYSNQDRFTTEFSGNVNRAVQIGAAVDYLYSKGSYDAQSDKDITWRVFSSYIGDRYEMQTFFNKYNFLNKESGGITDDRYITNPAEVQGGVTKVDTKTIPTNLSNAHSQVWGSEFYMNHRYKVGYYRHWNDTLPDTIIARKHYVPVTSFIWTMNYKSNKHMFLNESSTDDAEFFGGVNYLCESGTRDITKYWRLTNTIGIDLLEGSRSWAKFGLSGYATYEMRRYTMPIDSVTGLVDAQTTLTPLPEGVTIDPKYTDNVAWVGGQLTKRNGSLLTYDADARFGLVGSVVGDFSIVGNVHTKIKLFGDSVRLSAYGHLRNEEAPLFMRKFKSNHYVWNNDFGKVRRFRAGGKLYIPHTRTLINVGYETLQNYVFFNTAGVPEQASEAVHVLNATVDQRLNAGILNWDNTVTYQTTSHEDVLALPKLAVYSNLYLKFAVAGVLHVQLGVDCNYYTKYYAPAYNPATMSFHNQQDLKCGNFAFMNAYANMKLKKTRFFVAFTHFNQGMFGGDNYFSTPHYPLNPRRLQMGLSVDFTN
ncbi:MAG: putative porin [Muribaculaceae bacterium]